MMTFKDVAHLSSLCFVAPICACLYAQNSGNCVYIHFALVHGNVPENVPENCLSGQNKSFLGGLADVANTRIGDLECRRK